MIVIVSIAIYRVDFDLAPRARIASAPRDDQQPWAHFVFYGREDIARFLGSIDPNSIWFASLRTAIVAAMPLLRWQFSLRTLLVTTTLVTVVPGLIVGCGKPGWIVNLTP